MTNTQKKNLSIGKLVIGNYLDIGAWLLEFKVIA